MFLSSIKLENFRNYHELEVKLKPEPGIFIFLGQNARGKTNFLESIFLLSFPRSFRASHPSELVKFNENYFTIEAEFEDTSLKIGYQKNPLRRTYQKNGSSVDLKDYLTNFQTVIFSPEDIEIISGAPALRRRMIDTIISQTDREYFLNLLKFSHVLKQRNALLKQIKDKKSEENELTFWDSQLIDLTLQIHEKRKLFFNYASEQLEKLYAEIADDNSEKVEIEYKFSGKSHLEHYEDYESVLKNLLHDERAQEIIRGHTLVGPHRDDFSLKLNGKSVADFCSRGEKRSFMLAIKILEIGYVEGETGNKPVLLLDDVFSELDEPRRHKLLDMVKNYQTLITTVEKGYFAGYESEIHLYLVEENRIFRYNE